VSVIATFIGMSLAATRAAASFFSVNTTEDTYDTSPGDGACLDASGNCSLRAAVEETNVVPNTVHFIWLDAQTYTLTFGQLNLLSNQVIVGWSKNDTIIQPSWGSGSRVFFIDTPGRVDIYDVTVQYGNPTEGALNPGGGLWLYRGDALVSRSRFADNIGTPGGAISVQDGTLDLQFTEIMVNRSSLVGESNGINFAGGGLRIWSTGAARIWGSTFHSNEAQTGGAIHNEGYLEVTNSTFYGNISRSSGGALFQNAGESWIRFATITDNVCNTHGSLFTNQGGGIYVNGGFVVIGSSIVAENSDNRYSDDPLYTPDCGTPNWDMLGSGDTNLIGTLGNGCHLGWLPGDYVGIPAWPLDPGLGPFTSNGGYTWTRAPAATSFAVDTNDNTDWWFGCQAVYSEDQRLEFRPRDGNGDGTVSCDRGAVERQAVDVP
jgi:CSLREA domain-containing protein